MASRKDGRLEFTTMLLLLLLLHHAFIEWVFTLYIGGGEVYPSLYISTCLLSASRGNAWVTRRTKLGVSSTTPPPPSCVAPS